MRVPNKVVDCVELPADPSIYPESCNERYRIFECSFWNMFECPSI